MAELKGYGGAVKYYSSDTGGTYYINISDVRQNIYSWTLNTTADMHETTSFADNGEKTFIRGTRGWTASVEAYVDATYPIQPSDLGWSPTYSDHALLWMYLSDASKHYRGRALMSSFGPVVGVDSVETQTLEFQGVSDLIYSDSSV